MGNWSRRRRRWRRRGALEQHDRRPRLPTPLQCRRHLCHLLEHTQAFSAHLRQEKNVSESRFQRNIHGGGVRPIRFLSLSAAIILSLYTLRDQPINVPCTFLFLRLELVANFFHHFHLAEGIPDRLHVKSVRPLNRDLHPLNFSSGVETWLDHRGNLPKQRHLCAVRKSSRIGRPIVQIDIAVQRRCLDEIVHRVL